MKRIQIRAILIIQLSIVTAMVMCLPIVAEAARKHSMMGMAGDAPTNDSASSDVTAEPGVVEGIAGIVVDAAGAPIPGALIQPVATSPSSPVPDMAVMSGPDGRFVWPLGPGHYRVDAIVDGTAVASADVTVAGGALTNVQLRAGR